MKPKLVSIPSVKEPIQPSPGFAKNSLSDFKLDIMALCQFGCRYCSSNWGNYLWIHRERLQQEHSGLWDKADSAFHAAAEQRTNKTKAKDATLAAIKLLQEAKLLVE